MSYEKLRDTIIKRSKEMEFEVLDTQAKVNGCVIFLKHAMIHVETNNRVSIAFHVSTRPDIAAITTLMINEIEIVDQIFISEIFMFSGSEKDYVIGDVAFDKWEEHKATTIINKYVNERNLSEWFNSCTKGPTA